MATAKKKGTRRQVRRHRGNKVEPVWPEWNKPNAEDTGPVDDDWEYPYPKRVVPGKMGGILPTDRRGKAVVWMVEKRVKGEPAKLLLVPPVFELWKVLDYQPKGRTDNAVIRILENVGGYTRAIYRWHSGKKEWIRIRGKRC